MMAPIALQSPVPTGRLRINARCIGCGICIEIAADLFQSHATEDRAIVHSQPQTRHAWALYREAVQTCPVDAIECLFQE